jgi:hypothetical protein
VNHYRLVSCLAFAGLLASSSVHAQERDTVSPSEARIHVGPLALGPRLAIRNLGIDSNVHNASGAPERDVTATISPELRSWLRLGRVNLSATSSVDWNYFQRSGTERSFNGSQDGRAELSLGYVRPYASGSLARTRQRPNFEVDQRVERTLREAGGGLIVVAGPKLSLDLGVSSRTLAFDRTSIDGVALADSLNRDERRTALKARLALTPLTTVTVDTEYRQDRFDVAVERDTNTAVVLAGLELKPLALVSGRARVGWRQFTPVGGAVQDFRGVVADVELSYLARDLTRITARVGRDIEYSFDRIAPYYLSTGMQVEVTQALGASWDVVGRVGRTTLAYQSIAQADASRVDRVVLVGVGMGRKLGTNIRVGVDIDRAERESITASRRYDGMRVGGSVTYGF